MLGQPAAAEVADAAVATTVLAAQIRLHSYIIATEVCSVMFLSSTRTIPIFRFIQPTIIIIDTRVSPFNSSPSPRSNVHLEITHSCNYIELYKRFHVHIC